MKREFTLEQLKELREVNPRLTVGLFNEVIKDLNEEYSLYIFNEGQPDTYAFKQVLFDMEDIKVADASNLYFDAFNYPLIKVTEAKFHDFRRYYILNDEDDSDYLNELASLFEQAFINVYRVYIDEETKKIAFAFWL